MPSDMWAVGITLFQLLSGSGASPFNNFNDLLNGEPKKLPEYVPEYISAIVRGLLLKDPFKRLTCEQVLQALERGP